MQGCTSVGGQSRSRQRYPPNPDAPTSGRNRSETSMSTSPSNPPNHEQVSFFEHRPLPARHLTPICWPRCEMSNRQRGGRVSAWSEQL